MTSQKNELKRKHTEIMLNSAFDEDESHRIMMTFPCTFCDATFVTQASLTRHMIMAHGNATLVPVTVKQEKNMPPPTKVTKTTQIEQKKPTLKTNQVTDKKKNVLDSKKSILGAILSKPVVRKETNISHSSANSANIVNIENDDFEDQCHQSEDEDSSHSTVIALDIDPKTEFEFEDVNDWYSEEEEEYDDTEQSPYDNDESRVQQIIEQNVITKKVINGLPHLYSCKMCGSAFPSNLLLQQHALIHTIDRPHKCPVCSKGFVRKEHLTKHQSSVHSGMKFTCEFCGKDISRKDHLIRHIRNVHPAEYLGLPAEHTFEASQITPTLQSGFVPSDKTLRSLQPKPKKPYLSCDICNGHFKQLNDLYEHQSSAHSDIRRFKCVLCPKAFKRKEHLVKHQVLHTGEKNFTCGLCAKEFPRKDALQDHIRRLHILPMPTNNGAGNGSIATGFTNNNMNNIPVDYPCKFCDRSFFQRPNLVQHLKNDHGFYVDDGPATAMYQVKVPPNISISAVNTKNSSSKYKPLPPLRRPSSSILAQHLLSKQTKMDAGLKL